MASVTLKIARITIEGLQSRCEINEEAVQEYKVAMQGGATFPPITVFHDGSHYWLADGFHRLMAAKSCAHTEIEAVVHVGTMRDALMHSLGANALHGLRRTNADKRHAVNLMLDDPEWSEWSDSDIARACNVYRALVATVRVERRQRPENTKYIRGGEVVVAKRPERKEPPAGSGDGHPQQASASGVEPQKPEPPAAPPPPPQDPRDKTIAELTEQLEEATRQNKELLADIESMSKILDANDKMAAAIAEAKKWREQAEGLRSRINEITAEKGALVREASGLKRRLEKLEAKA